MLDYSNKKFLNLKRNKSLAIFIESLPILSLVPSTSFQLTGTSKIETFIFSANKIISTSNIQPSTHNRGTTF